MKIDRLIGILSVLLQQDMVTAPCLAERFEVSRRTINRDIEDLCRAGIPIVTMPGAGGGISIMENYKVDRTVFTTREMQDILAGLRSLDSVSGTNQYGLLMEKLSAGGSDFMAGNQSVLIDLSSWYKADLAPKIEIIRAAIPAKMRATGGHPSKRTFQAIRIECNRELEVLRDSVDALISLLHPGGRICIITFHSLEDRIVKTAFRRNENPCTCPPDFPVCVCGQVSKGKVITRKPVLPTKEELAVNKRAGSAKLRVFCRA